MSFLHLTAGAERILTLLKLDAPPEAAFSQLSARFISGLLGDEGRAAEILRTALVDVAALNQLSIDPNSESMSYLEWQRTLLRRADQYAIDYAEDGMTGTEHLLIAVVDLDPTIANFLLAFRIDYDSLLNQVREPLPDLAVQGESLIQIQPVEQGTLDAAALARILDASANRCREGLRVIEDYVRFHLDDATLQRELKQIRHQLTQTLKHLGQERWVPSRDSLRDVGPLGSLATERSRGSLVDVIRANFKRVEEALRSLEEYGKLIDAELALQISECRYRIYTIEKAMETVIHNRQRLEKCRLYLLVTAANSRYRPEILIRSALEKGVDVIQIREKEMPDRDLIAYGKQVREWTRAANALLIMNDRADLAAAIGADGVHLGQDDLDVASARRILGGTGIIGVSTHTPAQAHAAVFDGADYLGVGPVFTSQTKEFTEFAGLDYVQEAARSVSIPWFAIGGIHAENLAEVQRAGATRVAVSSVICQAANPRGMTVDLLERMQAFATRKARKNILPDDLESFDV